MPEIIVIKLLVYIAHPQCPHHKLVDAKIVALMRCIGHSTCYMFVYHALTVVSLIVYIIEKTEEWLHL